ncbi:hypothetical protein [Lysobacter sp. cf310]|uniref:hypothetical protein n=1 Tax=Lysobacter sp. cf310 TaxID=1761790 RepID=UPI0011139693|nr:hypothetical protein [Lysobacter sp. cf310]
MTFVMARRSGAATNGSVHGRLQSAARRDFKTIIGMRVSDGLHTVRASADIQHRRAPRLLSIRSPLRCGLRTAAP